MDVQKIIEERIRLIIGDLQMQTVILSARLEAALAEVKAKADEIDALKKEKAQP